VGLSSHSMHWRMAWVIDMLGSRVETIAMRVLFVLGSQLEEQNNEAGGAVLRSAYVVLGGAVANAPEMSCR